MSIARNAALGAAGAAVGVAATALLARRAWPDPVGLALDAAVLLAVGVAVFGAVRRGVRRTLSRHPSLPLGPGTGAEASTAAGADSAAAVLSGSATVPSGSATVPSGSAAAESPESSEEARMGEGMRERRLRRSQKLESIGEFTGAVAHDFNNLLTAIITPVQLLLADLPMDHPLRRQLEEVEAAATRGASLSRQLLAFSRKQVVQPRPHDLNEILEGLGPMLRRLLGASITLQLRTEAPLRTVVVDPTQMEQVVVNLVVNARDAMPDGGAVTVSTSNVNPSEDPVRTEETPPAAGYVVVEVSDTGHGFDEAVRRRIFEPYFSTKEHGTGLGLATVFGIARQFGGFVRVDSTPGEGSSFRVYLPTVAEPAQAVVRRREPASTPAKGGSELVLVVEDQEPVRQVLVRALTRFGYRVVQASSGEEALEKAAAVDARIDLLLTDVRLTGCTGPELARRLSATQPQLRVVYVSGFADQGAFVDVVGRNDWVFLPKPFAVEDLLSTVRRVLDRDPALGQTG